MTTRVGTPRAQLLCSEITGTVINGYHVSYDRLGFGFLESICRRALAIELRAFGLEIVEEAPIDVWYSGTIIGRFRADLLVENRVIVEIKTGSWLGDADRKQLLNYLRASDIEVGLLLLYGPKPFFQRFVFENARKAPPGQPRSSDGPPFQQR
jgi:GxxExxY protein